MPELHEDIEVPKAARIVPVSRQTTTLVVILFGIVMLGAIFLTTTQTGQNISGLSLRPLASFAFDKTGRSLDDQTTAKPVVNCIKAPCPGDPTDPAESVHPDGSLVINIPGENNPTGVYLIQNGARRAIGSGDIFNCLGYDWNKIVPANSADAALPVGSGLTCTPHQQLQISGSFPNGTVGQAYSTTLSTVNAQSAACSWSLDSVTPRIPSAKLTFIADTVPADESIQTFQATPTAPGTYSVSISVKCGSATAQHQFNLVVSLATSAAHPDGSLVLGLFNIPSSVSLIENGKLRPFPTAEIFMSHGYRWDKIVPANSGDAVLPLGEGITYAPGTLVRNGQSLRSYYLVYENNILRPFNAYDVFRSMGYSNSMSFVANPDNYKAGSVMTISDSHPPGTDIVDGGVIYRIGLDKKRHAYPSISVYNTWHTYDADFTRVLPANSFDNSILLGSFMTARQ